MWVLIGEFKRVPAPTQADIIGLESTDLLVGDNAEDGSNEDIDWLAWLSTSLLGAIEDAMRYCAIHFLIHPFAPEIIALASSGPFWKWATVKKEQVPSFNWLSGLAQPCCGIPGELRVVGRFRRFVWSDFPWLSCSGNNGVWCPDQQTDAFLHSNLCRFSDVIGLK